MFCRLLALFGIYIYTFVATDNSRVQPRPQGAFPWLWSYGKAPWDPWDKVALAFRAEKRNEHA